MISEKDKRCHCFEYKNGNLCFSTERSAHNYEK